MSFPLRFLFPLLKNGTISLSRIYILVSQQAPRVFKHLDQYMMVPSDLYLYGNLVVPCVSRVRCRRWLDGYSIRRAEALALRKGVLRDDWSRRLETLAQLCDQFTDG